MALALQHIKGFNGALRGSTKVLHNGQIVYALGSQIVIADEANLGRQALLRGHDDQITAFAASTSGSMVASGQCGRNSDVVIWDVATQQPKARFQEHDQEVVALGFSLDDRLLVTAGHEEKDQKLFVLDTSTGKIVAKAVLEFRKRVTAVAWAPGRGNSYPFATACDSEITLWHLDPYTGMLSQRKVTTGSVRQVFTSLVFSADGSWLYGGTASGTIVTVNTARAAIQLVHPACGNGVGCLILSSTGKLLVGGGDGGITLFTNDHMWRDTRPFVHVPGAITSISANHDGSCLYVGTAQGSIFRVMSGSLATQALAHSHFGGVTQVAFAAGAPDAVASSSNDGTVSVWSTQDHSLLQRITSEPSAGPALCAVLTPDLLITGWGDGNIRAYARQPAAAVAAAAASGSTKVAPAWMIPGAHSLAHSCGVTALAVAHRGHFVASGGAGGEIRVWDMRSREMVSHMKQHMQAINDIKVLADDAHIVAACEDRSFGVWDIRQEKCRASWRLGTAIKGVAVAPDQVTVLSVGLERNITLWDMRSPDPLRAIQNAHEHHVLCVAINATGTLVATGGLDGMVKLWDLRSGALLAQGAAHTSAVTSVAFNPADTQLVSGAADASVAFWAVAA